MKILAPGVTCIVASHMKPTLVTALNSVTTQTRTDVQIIVVDSGQWIGRGDIVSQTMHEIYQRYSAEPRVEWVTTGELPGLADRACPISWATNQVIRAGLVRGRYVCTFYDDDRYERSFMEKMAGFLDEHPEYRAVWCSQHRSQLLPDDVTEQKVGEIIASGPKPPGHFDQLVDGTQVMFHHDILDEIGDPWLPEAPADADCRHSDGVFLERVAAHAGIVPNIPDVLVTHRFTRYSTYSPM